MSCGKFRILLFVCVIAVCAAANPVSIKTGALQVSMTNDRPPKYTLSLAKKGSPTYQVFLLSIYEVVKSNKTGTYEQVPKTELSISQFTYNISSVNVSGSGDSTTWLWNVITESDPQRFNYISLTNHITTNSSTEMKFDLNVDDYKWVSGDPTASLAFLFQVNAPGGGKVNQTRYIQSGIYIDVGQKPENDWANNSVNCTLVMGKGDSFLLVYSHFEDHLTHDPIIGVTAVRAKKTSGGTVFGVIVLCILLLVLGYFILGIIVNLVFFQREGLDAIPHWALFAKLLHLQSSQYEQIPNQNA